MVQFIAARFAAHSAAGLPAGLATTLFVLLLAGCATSARAPLETKCVPPICPASVPASVPAICPPCPVCPTCPPALAAGPTRPGPPLQAVGWEALADLAADPVLEVLPALRQSCRGRDPGALWRGFCRSLEALGNAPEEAALRALLQAELQPWRVNNPDGSEHGLITGYYEPLIKGSRQRSARARWPIHGVPSDLVSVELGEVYPDLRKLRLRGRLDGRSLKPYWTRAEIEARAAEIPAVVLLWAEDPIELFFLQVQGSGRVELPGGQQIRIGYADQNGHPYQSIGRWLVDKGELSLSQASMAGIKGWAEANPRRLTEMLNANPSYVFFRELPAGAGGPVGALGVPLTAGRSLAVDPLAIPLGAPVFLDAQWPGSDKPLRRLMVAQDTGGAIKGAVRADFYWGSGPEAGMQAGRMRQSGRLWVLLPKGHTPP